MKFGPQLNHEIYVTCEMYCGRQHLQMWCPDSVVGTVYAAEWVIPGWSPVRFKRFFYSLEPSRPALEPN